MVETFEHKKSKNQNSLYSTKLISQRIKIIIIKLWGLLLNSPLYPLSLSNLSWESGGTFPNLCKGEPEIGLAVSEIFRYTYIITGIDRYTQTHNVNFEY